MCVYVCAHINKSQTPNWCFITLVIGEHFTKFSKKYKLCFLNTELWMEPKNKVYGPDYKSGRIRIAISRGNRDLTINSNDLSCKQLESGVLMGLDENVRGRAVIRENTGWHQKMHNFTVIWTPGKLLN